jgi:hypothetical protein
MPRPRRARPCKTAFDRKVDAAVTEEEKTLAAATVQDRAALCKFCAKFDSIMAELNNVVKEVEGIGTVPTRHASQPNMMAEDAVKNVVVRLS